MTSHGAEYEKEPNICELGEHVRSEASGLNDDGAGAWAVEFAEEYALPGAEDQKAVFYQDISAATNDGAFAVGIGVAFGVFVGGAKARDQFFEGQQYVVHDGSVGVFVYCYRCCSVGTIDGDDAVDDTRGGNGSGDAVRDINHFTAAFGVDSKILLHDFHRHNLGNQRYYI
jgi:hypothetical protein